MKIELLAAIFLVIAVGALTTPTVPYLRDFDPWYHYRLAEYTFEQGTMPSFDPLSNMGENIVYPPLLHYLLAIPAHLPGLNVMLVSQIYPLLAAALALIFVFLFTREVFDERTAMLAVILLAVLPIFKGTTGFGYSDHDPLDYLFISSTFFFFVKALKTPTAPFSSPLSVIEHKEKLVYYVLAGVSVGLFALTWGGFVLLVVILSAFMLAISLFNPYLKLLEKEVTIGFLVLSIVFAVIASLWYGFGLMPFLGMMLFSAIFSYVALRLENNRNAFLILLAIVLLCSLPLLVLSKSSIVDAELAYMLKEKGVYLGDVTELQTPTLTNISQHYGLQLLLFLAGLILFLTSLKKFNRATLFFLVSFALLALLASTAIRFLQYAGIFVSIFSAYLLNRLSDVASSSVKKDVFIPVMILSAALFYIYLPQIVHHSVSDDWYTSMQWLKNNSDQDAVVMSWWDYSQWVNGIAERKTVVNNQPPGRFDDQMIFFGTNDLDKARAILEKYDVSYVVVSRGYLARIGSSEKFLNETIEFNMASPSSAGGIYSAKFGTGFKTYYDPTRNVAWDEYPDGRKVYYKEFGAFTDKNLYFTSAPSGVELNDNYLFMFADLFIRMPMQTKNRVFFNLMYTNSTIPYLELVKDAGEVRVYKVVK